MAKEGEIAKEEIKKNMPIIKEKPDKGVDTNRKEEKPDPKSAENPNKESARLMLEVQDKCLKKTEKEFNDAESKRKESVKRYKETLEKLAKAQQKRRVVSYEYESALKKLKTYREITRSSEKKIQNWQKQISDCWRGAWQRSDDFMETVAGIVQQIKAQPSGDFGEDAIFEQNRDFTIEEERLEEKKSVLKQEYNGLKPTGINSNGGIFTKITKDLADVVEEEKKNWRNVEIEIRDTAKNVDFLKNAGIQE